MPYRESIFSKNNFLHVYCRGNEKRNIFLDKRDYQRFIERMALYRKIHQISIICYCLMPNHFHLILRQNTKQVVSKFMHRLTVSYSMYFNKRYARVGHLFQGRFQAKYIMKDEYLLYLSRYIHLNPIKIHHSNLALETYPWSSYAEFINPNGDGDICDKDIILQQFSSVNAKECYEIFMRSALTEADEKRIERVLIEPA